VLHGEATPQVQVVLGQQSFEKQIANLAATICTSLSTCAARNELVAADSGYDERAISINSTG